MQSDEDLIELVRQQDAEAFEALFARHAVSIRRHLARTVHDEAAAEDLLQEVFLRLWTRAAQWDARGTARGWLYRIATNLALNHLRSVRRHGVQPLAVPAGDDGEEDTTVPRWLVDASSLGPAAIVELAEQRDLLQRRLDALSEEKRAVWRLVHEEEMSVREAASALDIPEGTVKSRLHSVRTQLARCWQGLEEGEE